LTHNIFRKEAKVKVSRTIKESISSSGRRTRDKEKHKKLSLSKPKYNQKFCEKWLKIFEPWLRRDPNDPHKPFCRACQCSMDCNRCHLVRHELTTKHKRNLESYLTQGESVDRREVRVRQERSKYYHQRKPAKHENKPEPQSSKNPEELGNSTALVHDDNMGSLEEVAVPKQELSETEAIAKTEQTASSQPRPCASSASNQEGLKLLLQIHQDKNELMESFRELMGSQAQVQHPPAPAPSKERNHVDLFFESVSSSVKALSPKLIAEAKMRVSQLICELELRGLTDNSPHDAAGENPPTNSLFVLCQN
ncbi:hypothetical protein KR074_011956, partial [Drosophila pseudoananassae]